MLMENKYDALINEYCAALREHFGDGLISICVFGSVARGEAKADSDIDILVVADGLPSDIGVRTKGTNYIHENLKKGEAYTSLRKSSVSGLISDIFFTPEEIKGHPPILLDIIDDGVILYDKNSFLSNALKTLKEKLEMQKAKRVITKKGHFWLLKPDMKTGEIVEI